MKHSNGFIDLVEEAKKTVKEISIDEFLGTQDLDPSRVLIDVREDHEWNNGHIPGATHKARGILERDIEQLFPDRSQKIVLYCGGGFRSALSAKSLQDMGYENILSLEGGFRGWVERGQQIVQ